MDEIEISNKVIHLNKVKSLFGRRISEECGRYCHIKFKILQEIAFLIDLYLF